IGCPAELGTISYCHVLALFLVRSAKSLAEQAVAGHFGHLMARHHERLCHRGRLLGLVECLLQVPEDVVDVLDTDGQSDHVGSNAAGGEFLVGQLLVRGCSRMNDQTLAVAHVSQMREQLHVFYELLTGLATSLDAESEDRSRPLGQILLREATVWAVLKTRIV